MKGSSRTQHPRRTNGPPICDLSRVECREAVTFAQVSGALFNYSTFNPRRSNPTHSDSYFVNTLTKIPAKA